MGEQILSDEQQAVVGSKSTNLVVNAVAGSGKTRTLIERVKAIRKANPQASIACVGFTRVSIAVMQQRLAAEHCSVQFCGTLHSYAARQVNQAGLRCLTDVEQPAYRVAAAKVTNTPVKQLTQAMADGRNTGATAYYYASLVEASAYCLDSIIPMATTLASCRRHFDYVFFDEAQDSTLVDRYLVKQMAGWSLTTFLDPNQTIFQFRGASTEPFEGDQLSLTGSYRCPHNVCVVANQLGVEMVSRTGRDGSVAKVENTMRAESPDIILCRSNREVASMESAIRFMGEQTKVSTVHAAKGDEYDHVAILQWPMAGEVLFDRNLRYVAATRAKQKLTYICG